jgi:hypothetical protein
MHLYRAAIIAGDMTQLKQASIQPPPLLHQAQPQGLFSEYSGVGSMHGNA